MKLPSRKLLRAARMAAYEPQETVKFLLIIIIAALLPFVLLILIAVSVCTTVVEPFMGHINLEISDINELFSSIEGGEIYQELESYYQEFMDEKSAMLYERKAEIEASSIAVVKKEDKTKEKEEGRFEEIYADMPLVDQKENNTAEAAQIRVSVSMDQLPMSVLLAYNGVVYEASQSSLDEGMVKDMLEKMSSWGDTLGASDSALVSVYLNFKDPEELPETVYGEDYEDLLNVQEIYLAYYMFFTEMLLEQPGQTSAGTGETENQEVQDGE